MGKISSKILSEKFRKSSTNLQDLPNEVLLKIFGYFDTKELIRCAQVSKRIRLICYDETFWRKINLYKKTISLPFLEQMLENGCKYISLCDAILEGDLLLTKVNRGLMFESLQQLNKTRETRVLRRQRNKGEH